MNKEEVTIRKDPPVQQDCRHHWKIQSVAGPISRGVCKLCGTKKEFGNYLSDCVDMEKEDYLSWGGSSRHTRKVTDPLEEVFAELKGGKKNAVKAGA
ncbi:hypothetical protein ACFLW2_01910 [Chloroflexota bacterium]